MCDCFVVFFVHRRVGSFMLKKRQAGLCQVEGVKRGREFVLSFVWFFFWLLHEVVLVAECGQTGAREAMQL